MKVAYVDTSCLVAIALGERAGPAVARRMRGFDELVSSNLLEAELRAAFVREGVEADPAYWSAVSWVLPDRSLGPELERVLDAGYLRGADCWHLAMALYVAEDPGEMVFFTLDERQRAVARDLGFRV